MVEAITLKKIIDDVSKKDSSRILGILFATPNSEAGKSLREQLSYYNRQSSKKINFYLVGYGKYWSEDAYPDKEDVLTLKGEKWSYSGESKSDFVDELRAKSKWRYSGESELILLNSAQGVINFHEMIVLNLDRMLKDEVISSIDSLFQNIFAEVETITNIDTLSDSFGVGTFCDTLKGAILDMLPNPAKNLFKTGIHYRVL